MNRRRVSISGFLLSFFPFLYDFSPERCRSVRKSTNVAVPCVGAFCFMAKLGLCGFTGRDLLVTTSGGIFRCTFFTYRSTKPTTSGGHIFLCVKKDMDERHAKGLQSRPLESGFFIRGLGGETYLVYYEFALVQLTRFRPARRRAGGVRFTRLRRKAKHHLFSAITLPKALLPPDSIVLLQLRRIRNIYRITGLICGRKLGGCVSSTHSTAPQHAEARG